MTVITKLRKILIFSLLIILALGVGAFLSHNIKKSSSADLAKSCDNIFDTQCQEYLVNITKEKKYEEAIKIQRTRISENEKLLNEGKNKIKNKKWLSINEKEVQAEFGKLSTELAKKNKGVQKTDEYGSPIFEDFEKDYNQLAHNNFAIRDISLDTMIVATIQRKELKDYEGAIKTLENGRRILDENKYSPVYEEYIKMIERNILKNTKLIKND